MAPPWAGGAVGAMISFGALALSASRSLDAASTGLARSVQRLSSGLRVNGARDDAAGLAIAERMAARERGSHAAMRNVNDAVSLVQTADAALGQVVGLLQDLRELAVQSANGALADSDRQLLQDAATRMLQGLDSIAGGTKFNGLNLLDGSFEKMALQIGAGDADRLELGRMVDVRAHSLPSTGVAYSVNRGIDTRSGAGGAMPVAGLTAITKGLTVADADNKPVDLGPIAAASSGAQRIDQIVSAINAAAPRTGITATLDSGALPGRVDITFVSDRIIQGGDFGGFSAATTGLDSGSIADGPIRAEPLDEASLLDPASARLAIQRYDKAIAEVLGGRVNLGAMQARFESVLSQLQDTADAEQAARSRILDADFASETAQRARAAMLQQAGMAMLAQANLSPRWVLSLLPPPRGATA